MPNFVDLMESCLKNMHAPEQLLNHSKEVAELIREEVNKRIKSLENVSTNENKSNIEFLAVDSSRAIRELMDGSSLGIFRAIGLTSNKKEFRELETEFFYHSGKSNQLRFYESAKMEYLEAKVILNYLREESSKERVVLVDGSMFGRISHIPIELQIYERELFMVDYINAYRELFEEAKKKNVLLVGVSKDSRASFLKQIILKEMLRKLVAEEENFDELLTEKSPSYLQSTLDKVRDEKVKTQVKIILNLYFRSIPDVYFLNKFSELQKYFTLPIELSYDMISSRSLIRILKSEISNEDYIRMHFSKMGRSLSEEKNLDLNLTLNNVKNYPTIVSFYLVPAKNDSPIRVDVPSYCFGLNHKLEDLVTSGFINVNEKKLSNVISSLLEQYAGYKNYNVLLKRADEKVKLSNYVVDSVYLKIIEKKLGIILLPGRDYRRVRLH